MENKKYIIILIVFICICFLSIGYFNYEKILAFFEDREWEIAESFMTIKKDSISQVEAGKELLLLTDTTLELYGNDGKKTYTENIITPSILCHSCEEYMVVATQDTNTIYLIRGSEIVWKNSFSWSILNVSVNKNGYVTIIYLQGGYKCIKIFKPTGEEMFTTYLASTYALDVEMSYDNKTLYIAEIDTEGIKIKSNIKIIPISELETNKNPTVETILIGTDTLITDIEYTNKNELLILTDTGMFSINSEKTLKELGKFDVKTTVLSSIKDISTPVIIEKKSTGIFTNETNLKILKEETLEIAIEQTPQGIDTMNDIIALNLGDKVVFLNTNGKVVKRFELEKQLSAIKLYNKGSVAALVFRDRIELIKL